jgi:hypothetical protein
MAYDAARNVTVLFGGYRDPGIYFDDTWTFKRDELAAGQSDRRRDPAPGSTPRCATDSARQLLVLLAAAA